MRSCCDGEHKCKVSLSGSVSWEARAGPALSGHARIVRYEYCCGCFVDQRGVLVPDPGIARVSKHQARECNEEKQV